MQCERCKYYKSGQQSNYCEVSQNENFHTQISCDLVLNDNAINFSHPFFNPGIDPSRIISLEFHDID